MSAAVNKAVFLSYASQDAEAARRIAEALRAAGVEVWFDQNELVGGDAWDAKIRAQIAACALFVPVVSANTNARGEGYFRLEWKLAVDRSHLIAHDQAFLLPVVIDGTTDAAARVPPEFRAVQWTRLPIRQSQGGPDGEISEKFCSRVTKLLAGDAKPEPTNAAIARGPVAAAAPRKSRGMMAAMLGFGALIALAFWQPWKQSPISSAQENTLSSRQKSSARSEPETAASLAAKAFEHYYPFCTPGRLQLADEFGRRATELDPHYARGWGTRAGASARYLLRDWVSGEAARQRARDAQSFANRALSLDRNETEALLALGIIAWHQHANSQAETLFRRVMALDPASVQAPTLLSRVAREGGRAAEAVELMKGAVALAPRDPLVRLYAGFAYFDGWNFRKAAEQFEVASQVADFQGARVYRAWADFFQNGDVAHMRADLDKLDLVYAEDDGKLAINLVCALFERRADRVVETAGRSASTYIDDWWTPKAWFTALAYEIDRKDNLARQQWQSAEAVVRERLRVDPQDETLRMNLAITLARLGRGAEARADFDVIEAAWREQMSPIRARRLARFYAAMGHAATAVAWLRQCVNRPTFLDEIETPRTLQLDPWWDGIRNSGEFRALLANPPPPPAPIDEPPPAQSGVAPKVGEKTLAVLPFDNLSDDKANDIFSDGISEALINALGRVPGLTVKGRTSSFYFKEQKVALPPREMAAQLGVAYLLRGGVRRFGNTVGITAQLSRAATDEVVWASEPMKRELTDVFDVQDEIATLVARQLSLALEQPTAVSRSVSQEASVLYLQSMQLWRNRFGADYLEKLTQIETMMRRAVAIEPTFVDALVRLAEALIFRESALSPMDHAGRLRSTLEEGLRWADRAVEVDRNSAEAHALRAEAFAQAWRRSDADAAFQRAIQINPNFAVARARYARFLEADGRIDEAMAEMERSIQLDPLASRALDNLALMLIHAGRYTDALGAAERSLALAPDNYQALFYQAQALFHLGRKELGTAAAAKLAKLEPEPFAKSDFAAYTCDLLIAQGRHGDAVQFFEKIPASLGADRIFAAAALGRTSVALEVLNAHWLPSIWIDEVMWHPHFDRMRSAPEFVAWLKKTGLTEAHARAQAWRAIHTPEKPAQNK